MGRPRPRVEAVRRRSVRLRPERFREKPADRKMRCVISRFDGARLCPSDWPQQADQGRSPTTQLITAAFPSPHPFPSGREFSETNARLEPLKPVRDDRKMDDRKMASFLCHPFFCHSPGGSWGGPSAGSLSAPIARPGPIKAIRQPVVARPTILPRPGGEGRGEWKGTIIRPAAPMARFARYSP